MFIFSAKTIHFFFLTVFFISKILEIIMANKYIKRGILLEKIFLLAHTAAEFNNRSKL
jgi:hypothetical protein